MIHISFPPLLASALLAAVAAAIAGGLMGSYIVAKRIVFLSGSISHAVLGGMGFFLWLQRTFSLQFASPFLGALIAAIISALILGSIRINYKEREDTLIASLWSTGMAMGVIFISLTPGYNVELTNFLFGNILWATSQDVLTLLGFDVFLLTITLIYHKKFLAICFDEEQALIQGLSVQKIYALLLCLVAVSIVLLIQVVGAVLVITLLAIPPAIGALFSHRLSRIMFLAVIIGICISFSGLILAYEVNWPPGATIALIAAFLYFCSLVLKNKYKLASIS